MIASCQMRSPKITLGRGFLSGPKRIFKRNYYLAWGSKWIDLHFGGAWPPWPYVRIWTVVRAFWEAGPPLSEAKMACRWKIWPKVYPLNKCHTKHWWCLISLASKWAMLYQASVSTKISTNCILQCMSISEPSFHIWLT